MFGAYIFDSWQHEDELDELRPGGHADGPPGHHLLGPLPPPPGLVAHLQHRVPALELEGPRHGRVLGVGGLQTRDPVPVSGHQPLYRVPHCGEMISNL